MSEIKLEALREVKAAFERYQAEVAASNVLDMTKQTYTLYVMNFIRWLEGDFTPGNTQALLDHSNWYHGSKG